MGRKNIFWQAVNKVLEKDSKELMTAFLKLIFKVDLQPILDESGQFEFFLLVLVKERKTKSVLKKQISKTYPQLLSLTKIFKRIISSWVEQLMTKVKLKDNRGNMTRKKE